MLLFILQVNPCLRCGCPFSNTESGKFSDLPVHASKGGCRMRSSWRKKSPSVYHSDSCIQKWTAIITRCYVWPISVVRPTLWFWRPPIQKVDRRDTEKWVHFVKGGEKHLNMTMLFGIPEIFFSVWKKLLWIVAALTKRIILFIIFFPLREVGMLGVSKYIVVFYITTPKRTKCRKTYLMKRLLEKILKVCMFAYNSHHYTFWIDGRDFGTISFK